MANDKKGNGNNNSRSMPGAPAPAKPARPVDFSMITPERRAALEAEALEHFTKEQQYQAERAYMQQHKGNLEREKYPVVAEEMRTIRVDLADYCDRITLDGKVFWHGELYEVPKKQYDVIMECMASSQRHEDEVKGNQDSVFYRKNRNRYTMSMKSGAHQPGDNLRF